MFDDKEQRWMPWTALVPRYVPRVNQKFYEIMVPTVDSVRNTWLLNLAIQNHQPILFMGESGTAKTVTIQNYLSGLNSDAWAKLDINFSSRTTSLDLQRTIEYNVERWSKGIYGPSPGKNLVLFIDDVNMPKVDKYSTQQPIALLKLVIERGGFYDRGKELNWKTLRNVQVVAAMGPPGGGRNSVDPRFVSLFNVFNIPFPQQDTLKSIYSSILEFHLEPFSDGIKEQIGSITESTMRLYQSIQSTLPPTPSKFHYIFNMRDLSRVYEGLCQATIDKFDTPDSFIRLWRNECLRVFHDRLISDHDRELVKGIINNIIKEKFTDYADHALVDPILYGDFKNAAQDVEDVRIYEDLRDYDALKPIFEEILLNYNEKNSPPMNLVLFEDALDHLTRIIRIICRPRGHALLVGIGGSGRQSLTRLAAFAAEYSLFEISLTGGYGEPELREDLKKLYNILGIDDKPTVFLFTDNHVVEEGFLELINNMLTTGMVPALFSDDEKEGIINAVRDDVVKARILDTKENCWKFFLDRARDNLSIVLCMSPTGEALRRRCRAFPGLVNNTVIDWFTPWPEQALFAVANVFLAEEDLPEEYRSDLVHHMVSTHLSVSRFSDKFEQLLRRKNHVTPKNFLDYINIYRKLLRENRKRMIDQTKRLDGGLHKLIEASTHLAELNEKLQVQKTHVDEQTLICSNLLSTIGQSKEKVEASQTLATQKERELQELSGQIQVKKADAEASLEAALPVLEAAKHALQNLSKNEVTEIRSFAKPPKAVQVVCECVAIVRNMKDVSWKGAKAMMTSPNFLNELLELNADEITEKQIRAVKDNIKNLGMPPEKMSTISNAGAGLLTWLLAIVNYCSVAKKVVPKRKAVEMAQKQQKQNQKDLENIKAEVQSLTEELGKLSEQYNQGIAQQKELQEQAELMEKRLTAAHKLISGLSTEKIRWTQELEVLAESQKRVVGDSLLCASFLSYCGPFSFEFRHAMVYGEWYEDLIKRSVPVTNPFRLETLLTSEVEISKWASEGLPSDELSVQNGIFTTRSSRWPLCIDPQMQAVNWIKKKESNSKLVVRSFSDADFAKQLELAVAYGVPMLIEGVDEFIDPLLDPVLEKNINILGDKEVDWNDNFRLYLATKLSNPVYPPGYFGKMSIINCNVTQHGLQEQLLNIVVGFERPELEQQREQLVREMSENRTLLKNFEDMLLEELANSSGMMLDNQELISTLEDTKTKSIEIAEKLELAKVTSEEIDKLRDGYQDAAKRGAILFFVLSSLSAMNTMYEHSLAAFTEVFKKALVASAPDPSLSRRLLNIINTLTQNVYDYTCMGLFEKHKLLFSFQMCIQIMRADEHKIEIRLDYLDFFLKGNFSLEKSQVKNPFPSWLPDQGWEDLQKLVSFKEPFSDLVNHLTSNEKLWKDWYDLDSLEIVPPPIPGAENWTTFQRLLVLRCFRVDRVYNSVRNFVMENMGERFVQPPVVTYNDIYEKSSPLTPVIFILSPGADPANDVIKLAEKMGFGGTKLKLLALGQNQGPVAAQLLENGVQRGQWIMLQNCHLLTSWLKTLETILDGIKNPHKDFRLWLTTEPTPAFPIGTLQRSLKVVTEPPNGLKLNMRSSFSKITNDVLAQSPHFAFRPLVYVLAFFHAVVQERRKYDKVGWNVPYDFNESDFSVSLKILDTYLTKANQNGDTIIPWGSLRYLIGEVMYGGRVTDSFDRRVLMTYLHEYMGDFLFDTFQPFFFYKDNHVTYSLPKDGPLENYIEMIESLPHVNTPDVFGLHPNAEIGYYTNASKDIWTNLILLQPNMSDTAGGSRRENIIANIANDILQKIPEPFDIPLIQKGIEAMTPTTVVLLQELERWNKLVETIKQTLLLLQKALVGEIGMSTELEELSQSLFVGGIPNVWRKLAPDTQKSLANWLIHFRQRYEQYNNWIKEEPIVMWMSGLHVPEAYLTALVQTACRKNKWPLDKTSLFTKVTTMTNASQIKERPEQGCYISGLYLEGAAWDYKNSILRRQDPKMLVVEFPIIHIIPMEVHKLRLQGTFHTPVYITQERRNKMGSGLVFAADLPTKEHPSHWVLQGVCLTLNVA